MEMSKAWPDTFYEGYVHQFQPETTQNSLAAAEAPSLKISSHGTTPKWSRRPSNQHENSHKLCDETRHPVVNLMERVNRDRKSITEFTRSTSSTSSTRIGKPVLMMDVKISEDKNISRWIDRQNLILIYVTWNRIKNRAQIRRRWLIEEKEVRHWAK